MRVRDVITQSLDAAVHVGLLPAYPPRPPPGRVQPRIGSPWSEAMIRTVERAQMNHPFYAEPDAVPRAAAFVEQFTARIASQRPWRWLLPRCFGPFGAITMEDAYQLVEAALKDAGLQALSHDVSAHAGSFTMTEQIRVDKLPAFYGHWLAVRHNRDPWDGHIDLCIAVELRIVLEAPARGAASGTGPARYAALELSAPAVALLQVAQHRLERTLPPGPSAALAMLGLAAKAWRLPPPIGC